MYRIVIVKGEQRIPLPTSKDQGKLFEKKKDALSFGKALSLKYPHSRFELEEYGPMSPYDWLICDNCKAAIQQRMIVKYAGCWRCSGTKLIRGPNPPWWRKLRALCQRGLGQLRLLYQS